MRFLLLLLFSGALFAQQPEKARVGFVATTSPETLDAMIRTFSEHLRTLGYVEGKNLSIGPRVPNVSKDPALADTLARSKPDVVVAWATPASLALQRATSTIPVVFVGNSDPVGTGLVRSMARPGGNITGVSNHATDLAGKQVQLILELLPATKRIGVIFNRANPAVMIQFKEIERAIREFRLQSEVVEARSREEFDEAFRRLGASKVGAVLLAADPSLIEHRDHIAALALKHRLPTIFQREENVKAGGLLSYGPSLNGQLRQAARYVDKILKGAKPADLPVEQPESVEMVLSAKTAKALGIKIPQAVQLRAQVID